MVDGERETCPGCGFEWAAVPAADVSSRIDEAVAGFAVALESPHVASRPEPERWSALEYAAHTRDVLLNVRDRVVLAAVEVCPSPHQIYREERVAMGLYATETAESLRASLGEAARLFTTTFDAIAPAHADRTLIYSKVLGEERTIGWTGAQVVHECEHHLGDVVENARRLAGR